MTYKMQPRQRCSQKNKNQLRISLQEHTKRTSLQGQTWLRATSPVQCLPDPEDCGWTKNKDGWKPRWA